MMARADDIRSSMVLLPDRIPTENISGWLIWELVILSGFVVLTLLTLLFVLTRTGFWERMRKKRKTARKKPKKKRSATAAKRKRSAKGSGKKPKKAIGGRGRGKKKPRKSKSLKMPFLPDPRIIKSYTGKYLVGEKIKADWERVSLTGYDSEEVPLNLDVYLLANKFQWPAAGSDGIKYRGKIINPAKYLKTKALKKAFQGATGLISVGLVTELNDGEQTEGLARTRAENMVIWLQKVMPRMKVDYRLILDAPRNVWGSIDEEDRGTVEKRAVLWICLRKSPDEVNMEEALKDALSQAINLPFDFDVYHEVTLEKIDTV